MTKKLKTVVAITYDPFNLCIITSRAYEIFEMDSNLRPRDQSRLALLIQVLKAVQIQLQIECIFNVLLSLQFSNHFCVVVTKLIEIPVKRVNDIETQFLLSHFNLSFRVTNKNCIKIIRCALNLNERC